MTRRLAWVAAVPLVLASACTAGRVPPGAPTAKAKVPRSSAAPGAMTTAEAVAAAQSLFDRRSRAMLGRDGGAFDATIAPDAFAVDRDRQHDAFTASLVLPFRSWQLRIATGAARPPDHGRWVVLATLTYAFAGFDATPVSLPRVFALSKTSTGWGIAADTQRDAPWDFGPLTATRDDNVLVLAHRERAGAATRLRQLADTAIPAVTKAWGPGWSQRVVIVIPETLAELEAELVTNADLSKLAAVQSVELDGAQRATGDRILINPTAFLTATSPLGQQVILTHEITHVASASVTTPNVPLWLVEGLADTVGFGTTSLTPKSGAPELAKRVATGDLPAALPVDADFSATSATSATSAGSATPAGSATSASSADSASLVEAYEQAWLACRLIRDRVGMPALVAFYRAVGGGQSVDAALMRTLHTTLASFTAAWRASLRAELA